MTRRPNQVLSGLQSTPPLLSQAGYNRRGRTNGGCYINRLISKADLVDKFGFEKANDASAKNLI